MSQVLWEARRALGRTRAYTRLKQLQELTPAKRADQRRRVGFYRAFVPRGGLAFDVGANMGNRTAAFLALGANVVAVEPQARCVSTLVRRFGTNPALTVVPVGLSSKPGVATLHVATNHVLSSMSDNFVARMDYQHNEWSSTQEVRVSTLDSLIDVFGVPDFCKIDVEGFEVPVLQGLSRAIPALSIEHNPPLSDATLDCLELISALSPEYEFAFSPGESMTLNSQGWVRLDEAKALIRRKELPFGDFYARGPRVAAIKP